MKSKTLSHGVDMNKIKQGAIASAVITDSLLSSGCSSSDDDEFQHPEIVRQAGEALISDCPDKRGSAWCDCVGKNLENIFIGLAPTIADDLYLMNKDAWDACLADSPPGRRRMEYWEDVFHKL